MSLAFATAVLAASVLLTYFCCMRPVRRGACAVGQRDSLASRTAEISRLHGEVAALRAELEHHHGRRGSNALAAGGGELSSG